MNPDPRGAASHTEGADPPLVRLLLVSDDVPSAEALRAHLVRHGFRVAQATSARTATHAVDEIAPDVVLIDAAVHGGWRDVTRSLEGYVPRGRIGVLAAYWSTAARREAEELGIGATFLKQLEGDDLPGRLRGLIVSDLDHGAANPRPSSAPRADSSLRVGAAVRKAG